jgi:large subunit ribosomal protein L31
MKTETHPEYHTINIVMTDGTEYQTKSTWGKEGDTMRLDVDCKSHPAWNGGTATIVEKGQLSKFENKYGSFLSGAAGKEANKKEKAAS